jgi:hypothetical protein
MGRAVVAVGRVLCALALEPLLGTLSSGAAGDDRTQLRLRNWCGGRCVLCGGGFGWDLPM